MADGDAPAFARDEAERLDAALEMRRRDVGPGGGQARIEPHGFEDRHPGRRASAEPGLYAKRSASFGWRSRLSAASRLRPG
jgi:hypothetical protein